MKIKSIFSRVLLDVFKKSGDELAAQLKVLKDRPPFPEKRFLLFAYGRSGSELLRSLINSHPEIYCDEEIFLDRRAVMPKRYLDNLSRIPQKKIYGYKAKLPQLELQYKNDEKLKEIFLSSDFKIIYLRRKNYLRQAISIIIGNQRNKWHDSKASPLSGKKFQINCSELLELMHWIEIYEHKEKKILEGTEYLSLTYEGDLLNQQNHQETLNKVFQYVGVKPVPVETNFFKTTSSNLSDFIENHEEVMDVISKTKYADLLGD